MIILIYWIITTLIGTYWLVKYPSFVEDSEYINLLEIVAKLFLASILAWAIVPAVILLNIRFKR